MGCDIHMYLEYTDKKTLDRVAKGETKSVFKGEKPYWGSFGGRINPGRNYWMFGFISKGVRSFFDNGLPAKGLPPFDELGYHSRNDSVCYISETLGDENSVTLETALRWAEGGRLKIINDQSGKPRWVEHPDWHSHTWLTTSEFESAIKKYKAYCKKTDENDTPIEYLALLSAMKTFDKNGYVSRLVVWFDN